MKNSLETRLGIFFAIIIISAVFLVEMVGGLDFFRGGRIRVRAQFSTIQDLKKGDPVKMAGVPIGYVEKLALVNDKVDVTMKISREAGVKTSSRATIKFLGMMGQNYVAMDFGTNTVLATEGAILDTVEQPDMGQVMAKLGDVATGIEELTKSFSGGNLDKLLGPLTDFLKENKDKFGGILSNVQKITGTVAEGKGTVGKLINDDTLYTSALAAVTNLNDTAADVRSVVNQAKLIVADVNEGKGNLGKLVKDETLYKEATETMTNAKEIMQKINRGQGSVGKLVNDESLFKNLKLTLQKLDKATEGLEDQGPLSLLGVAASSLF